MNQTKKLFFVKGQEIDMFILILYSNLISGQFFLFWTFLISIDNILVEQ